MPLPASRRPLTRHLRPATVIATLSAAAALGALTLSTAPVNDAHLPAPVGHLTAPAGQASYTAMTPETPLGAAAGRKAPAAAKRAGGAGYTLIQPGLAGITPKGLTVYVDRGAAHQANIVSHTKAAVKLWRSYGIKATYAGYGTPKAGEGVVTVAEGPAGCGPTARVGNTWTTRMPLADGRSYVLGAKVVLCPSLWDYDKWQWSATIRHELGHAAGLGHFDQEYKSSTQVMRWVNTGGVSSYQAGDANGLKFLARGSDDVKAMIPAIGRFETADYVNGQVKLGGWALLENYPSKTVTMVLTDKGKEIARKSTDVYRADINAKYDPGTKNTHGFLFSLPWNGGSHKYCLQAVSPVNPKNTTDLGCSVWN